MDQAEHYYQLTMLGREAFMRSAAPAALVRRAGDAPESTRDLDAEETETLVAAITGAMASMAAATGLLRIYPVAKKQGAPFADMITIGRTGNNDIVVDDVTVSRFHAYLRLRGARWMVADSGSKNGSKLDGVPLEARKETAIMSGQTLLLGDVKTTFYTASDLFDILSGSR